MRRVIIAGGTGFFGRAALELLAEHGIAAIAASRRHGALNLDVENPDSLRRTLQPGDVLIDTVGPFQDRTTTLLEAAVEIGVDVIDISDSLSYARRVAALADPIAARGICVLSSCSSVSAISAWLVRQTRIDEPVRASGFLAPSARYSASAATADSLLRSVGRRVEVWHAGQWASRAGWLETRSLSMPAPIGALRGRLFETADSFWLPRIWPSLKAVDYYVDTRVAGLNRLLSIAARAPRIRRCVQRWQSAGHRIARLLGPRSSCLAVEVEAPDGTLSRQALHCPNRGYRLAVLPAVLAARAIVAGAGFPPGLQTPDRQVVDSELESAFDMLGFEHLGS
jgi:hypothetical protein